MTCFTQMTANKGIKLLGEIRVAAMFKEYKQLDDLDVLGILDPDLLTSEQKRNALRAINLIKVKRDGKVKGRTCADGSSQRKYVPREEASSPTILLESIISSPNTSHQYSTVGNATFHHVVRIMYAMSHTSLYEASIYILACSMHTHTSRIAS